MHIQPHIHLATPEDMLELSHWLYSNDSIFEYNLVEIQDEFQQGRLLVLTITKNNIPVIVGFCSMRTDFSPHFFEIQEEFQGLGFGKKLVEYVMTLAQKAEIKEMTIQCSPRESYSFWNKLGFEKISDDGVHIMAYQKLPKLKNKMGWENSQPIPEQYKTTFLNQKTRLI